MSVNLSKKEEIALAITTSIISNTVKGDLKNSGDRSNAITASIDIYNETMEQLDKYRKVFHL